MRMEVSCFFDLRPRDSQGRRIFLIKIKTRKNIYNEIDNCLTFYYVFAFENLKKNKIKNKKMLPLGSSSFRNDTNELLGYNCIDRIDRIAYFRI